MAFESSKRKSSIGKYFINFHHSIVKCKLFHSYYSINRINFLFSLEQKKWSMAGQHKSIECTDYLDPNIVWIHSTIIQEHNINLIPFSWVKYGNKRLNSTYDYKLHIHKFSMQMLMESGCIRLVCKTVCACTSESLAFN